MLFRSTSSLPKSLKKRLFVSTVEATLLYGAETWSLTKTLAKGIDGCYTRMVRMALNVFWEDQTQNEILSGNLPKVTAKIRNRRMHFAGHIIYEITRFTQRPLKLFFNGVFTNCA